MAQKGRAIERDMGLIYTFATNKVSHTCPFVAAGTGPVTAGDGTTIPGGSSATPPTGGLIAG